MLKEYKKIARSFQDGTHYTIEIYHDGVRILSETQFFGHLYRGKGGRRKIIKIARQRADEYVANLEAEGYQEHHEVLREREFLRSVYEKGGRPALDNLVRCMERSLRNRDRQKY